MWFIGCYPLDYLFWDRVSHWPRVHWVIQAGWQAPRWLSLSCSSVLAWRTGSHLSVIISGGSGWTTPQTSPHLRFWRLPPGDYFFCTSQLLFPGLLKKQRDKKKHAHAQLFTVPRSTAEITVYWLAEGCWIRVNTQAWRDGSEAELSALAPKEAHVLLYPQHEAACM